MNDKLFIPKKIRVGYQERDDTYTQRLAYVIYFDSKGKLCKEKSWSGWCQLKDMYQRKWENGAYTNEEYLVRKALPVDDYDNVPMSGFVLNKKAGGYSSGWNHRQMKCRVFDPRGFEFEIAIDNLLFILQECSSLKGKGLDGEFVYAWSGGDIVLLPTSSEDYVQSQVFTDLKTMKVSTKELKEGLTYLHKNTNQMVYMGKFDWMEYARYKSKFGMAKEHIFYDLKQEKFLPIKVPNLAKIVDTNIVSNYAELFENMRESTLVGPYSVEITPFELDLKLSYERAWINRYDAETVIKERIFMLVGSDTYLGIDGVYAYLSNYHRDRDSNWWNRRDAEEREKPKDEKLPVSITVKYYKYHNGYQYTIKDGVITQQDNGKNRYYSEDIDPDALRTKQFFKIRLVFYNDKKRDL